MQAYQKVIMELSAYDGYDESHINDFLSGGVKPLPKELGAEIINLKSTTYLNMSQIHLTNKDWERAKRAATNSMKWTPTAKGYFRRGTAYLNMGILHHADADFKAGKELDPSNAEFQVKLDEIQKIKQSKENAFKDKMKNMFS
eukprot:TRINITY_DN1907_c0_g4_i1.p2 TRINITY_DN1907_c0_g4~~TRINITY_DN1907_c0_g4_i1.p2  ORF type:complete len:143 (-),score=33.05 TRINITY_DN1907_c0_g4_i1:270-698(-)